MEDLGVPLFQETSYIIDNEQKQSILYACKIPFIHVDEIRQFVWICHLKAHLRWWKPNLSHDGEHGIPLMAILGYPFWDKVDEAKRFSSS